ncbi:IS66 family transposase [Thalassotalea sp. PS06]|uniref:IS66 family transposase n=1 Tax=Thalassotalea sp. PS06 TaxID=2594005 RepID=UPI0011643CE2|nr:IS66 family transposase [Thalassotalea sp. PS06]QDP02765.1 IS66 family transposase [Thalassotalea sp. PS06]
MKFDAHSLPNDPDQLKQMLLELQDVVAKKDNELAEKDDVIAEQSAQIHELLARYNAKLAKEYGKKSEKMPGAGEVFNEAEAELDAQDKALLKTEKLPEKAKRTPKRRPLPESLPRVEVTIDLDEKEKVCDCCKGPLHQMGESSSEALEFVLAHIKVIRTVRPKYACRVCDKQGIQSTIKTAPLPATPIPKSMATPGLLSQIITCKYQFGLPLYRQETLFADIEIELSRQTMSSWMLRCAQLLKPLYQRLQQTLLSQPVIHADETPMKVINAEKATNYMWLYCTGEDKPGITDLPNIVLFDYQNSRAGQCAVDFLQGLAGYLQVDGYQAYAQTDATLVACLAHMRRKFIEAKGNNKKAGKADVALSLIGKLYGIEQGLPGKTAEEKYQGRQQLAKPIVDKLHQWLLDHKDKIPPKTALGKAILYSLNQFEKFQRYLDDGRLNIDNNRAERAIKPFVIGRKAWLFSNTKSGAEASAILYSLVETAKANDLVVHEYISTCLQHMAQSPDNLDAILPWNFQRS